MPRPMSTGRTAIVAIESGTEAYPIIPKTHNAAIPTISSESKRQRTRNIKNSIKAIIPMANSSKNVILLSMLLLIACINLVLLMTVVMTLSSGCVDRKYSTSFIVFSAVSYSILPTGVKMMRVCCSSGIKDAISGFTAPSGLYRTEAINSGLLSDGSPICRNLPNCG